MLLALPSGPDGPRVAGGHRKKRRGLVIVDFEARHGDAPTGSVRNCSLYEVPAEKQRNDCGNKDLLRNTVLYRTFTINGDLTPYL